MTTRIAPQCWAVVEKKPGVWAKRLLLPFEDTPANAVATFKFERQAETDITTRENVFRAAAETKARQASMFEEDAMGDLVPIADAKEQRNERTDIALSHADPEWKGRAWTWLTLRKAGATFTSDDLTSAIGMPTTHPSGVGALFNAAARAGLIEKTGSYVTGRRRSCNGTVLAVWIRKG